MRVPAVAGTTAPMHRLLLGLSLLPSLLALPATGQTVTDGDTIRVDGKAVRLWAK